MEGETPLSYNQEYDMQVSSFNKTVTKVYGYCLRGSNSSVSILVPYGKKLLLVAKYLLDLSLEGLVLQGSK